MKSWNYWQQFVHTGRIDDYLSYVAQESNSAVPESGYAALEEYPAQAGYRYEETKKEDSGVRQDAGICMCNRNDTEADAYR